MKTDIAFWLGFDNKCDPWNEKEPFDFWFVFKHKVRASKWYLVYKMWLDTFEDLKKTKNITYFLNIFLIFCNIVLPVFQ